MTESPDSPAQSASATPTQRTAETRPEQRHAQPSRLNQVLAWVGLVAGVLFIVALIFFAGFVLGRASDGYHDWNRGYHGGQMNPGGSMGSCPMRENGGMMGPGQMGPGEPSPTPTSPPRPTG